MRPLLVAVLILSASPWARSQSRVGVVEAASNPGAPSASLTSTFSGASAPQLVTLNLATPLLSAAPGLQPTALAPSPLIVSVPYAAAALSPAPLPVALPASSISPFRPAAIKPANAALNSAKSAAGDAPTDFEKTSNGDLIDFTKRMFGESSKPGYQSAEYLRPGEPFQFGASEVFRYRTACGTVYGHTGNFPGYTLFAAATSDGSRSVTVIVNEQLNDNPVTPVFTQLRAVEGLGVCAALHS